MRTRGADPRAGRRWWHRSPARAAHVVVRYAAGVVVAVTLPACGGGAAPEADTGTAVARPPALPSPEAGAPAIAQPGCPESGLWERCNVEERLDRAGVVLARRAEGVRHDFFSVPGDLYENSRVELQVFIFPSAEARARETRALDSVAVAPPTQRIVWRWPATLVTSNNLAAIILSLNERSVERIALALGAGLPAAPPR